MTIDESLEWDSEAIDAAFETANMIEESDPQGAAQLRAQAQAAQRRRLPSLPVRAKEPYDPIRLYSFACKYYEGWRPKDCDAMHFVTFFAMIREATLQQEREREEYDKAKRGTHTTTPEQAQQEVLSAFPQARQYQGETVAI